jgi:hypothetical protein
MQVGFRTNVSVAPWDTTETSSRGFPWALLPVFLR